MADRRGFSESGHCLNCGRHRTSCVCGQPYRSGHVDPEFYQRYGFCDQPCQECNRLDERAVGESAP